MYLLSLVESGGGPEIPIAWVPSLAAATQEVERCEKVFEKWAANDQKTHPFWVRSWEGCDLTLREEDGHRSWIYDDDEWYEMT